MRDAPGSAADSEMLRASRRGGNWVTARLLLKLLVYALLIVPISLVVRALGWDGLCLHARDRPSWFNEVSRTGRSRQ